MCPNKIKYPREIRKQVYDLYQEGRSLCEVYTKGKHKLKDISEQTGVPVDMVHKIGNGER